RKLAAEGLFDDQRKQPIPYLPDVIGVVTSPTGAVIRDILHRLADRFPRHVLLWPVLVQGSGAAAQIAAAIDGFNRLASDGPVPRPDLLIVARGGGGIEDLMAFNEEVVVRAAAASAIPLISAVGHETDTTLIDFASDRRAPTPTAAAEMAVPVRAELRATVLDAESRLLRAMARGLDERRIQVAGLVRGLPDAETLVETATQRLDDWSTRLRNAPGALVERRAARLAELGARLVHPRERLAEGGHRLVNLAQRLIADARHRLTAGEGALQTAASGLRPGVLRERIRWGGEAATAQGERLVGAGRRVLAERAQGLDSLARLLESASYSRVLERGFVLVRDADGTPVTAAAATRPGQGLELQFHDGEVAATVDGAPGRKPRRRAPRAGEDEDQGSLL
ncbi:MAG: exodeoxyribonuclease VII large subunit, partial [Alphaproteobacteria bacterium]